MGFYFRQSAAVILMYDISDMPSFLDLAFWKKQVDDNAPKNIVLAVVGNKSDLGEDARQVSKEQGQRAAKEYGALFFEVSAKSGTGISDLFTKLGDMIIEKNLYEGERIDTDALHVIDDDFNPSPAPTSQPSSGKSKCCA